MNGNDRLGGMADRSLQLTAIERIRYRVNIDENSSSAGVVNGGDGGDKSERNRDDLIPRPDAQSQQSQMEGAGAGIHGHPVTGSAIPGKTWFKSFPLLSSAKAYGV